MSTATANELGPNYVLPGEVALEGPTSSDEAYQRLLERLCAVSVTKRYEAFKDIDWDDPEMKVDPDDSRWRLSKEHPLGGTHWYQSQPAEVQSRIGLNLIATFCYTGRIFEGILSRGLLRFAAGQPHNSLEYRYAYHEVIEEAHHSLMFQELVNRSGLPVPLISEDVLTNSDRIVEFGASFPEMLFIYALSGEDPIDYAQRQAMAKKVEMHPLSRRISQIHITEEARHVSFARAYLRRNVPRLSPERKEEMSLAVPTVLSVMSKMMMQAPEHIIQTYSIPEDVVDEAYVNNSAHRQTVVASLAKIRTLCEELGLMTPAATAMWHDAGLLPER